MTEMLPSVINLENFEEVFETDLHPRLVTYSESKRGDDCEWIKFETERRSVLEVNTDR